jgi:hypothetical protein
MQAQKLIAAENCLHTLAMLKYIYPDHIREVREDCIIWTDGTCMPFGTSHALKPIGEWLDTPSLIDQLEQPLYLSGNSRDVPTKDPGRIRYEPFFRKMYGNSPEEVTKNLKTVAWMPKIFGPLTRLLLVTKINNIHKKIQQISDELELLACIKPEYVTFLQNPGGTYCWRNIANTHRLSSHSFGMTLDINAEKSSYWQWDLIKENRPICEDALPTYRNSVPWEIVQIFEKYGFIWGGKWYHYDTMHFEYRPELIV